MQNESPSKHSWVANPYGRYNRVRIYFVLFVVYINKERTSWEELKKTSDDKAGSDLALVGRTQDLWKEMQTISLIKSALALEGIEETADIDKLINTVIPLLVLALPKTHETTVPQVAASVAPCAGQTSM